MSELFAFYLCSAGMVESAAGTRSARRQIFASCILDARRSGIHLEGS